MKQDKKRECGATYKPLRKLIISTIVSVIVVFLSSGIIFTTNAVADDGMAELKKLLQSQIELMKPELQEKVKGLSTDTKMTLMSILAMHSRYSDKATLRQVMLEVLSDYQSIVMAVMTDSSEMAADSARRLANHRIPVGGLLPYMGLENITDDRLATLESFNNTVEGNSLKLAEAADKGDMATAAQLLGTIGSGCVGCHAIFRPEIPGKSDLLR